MKTSFWKEREIRALDENATLEDIARCGVIPLFVVSDNNPCEVTEATFCESISGGKNEVDNMPKKLSLTRLKLVNGKLHKFEANYKIVE